MSYILLNVAALVVILGLLSQKFHSINIDEKNALGCSGIVSLAI